MPVLWAQSAVHAPADLAVIHALVCALLPLFSLAACLAMLRGEWARLRLWPVIGILLVPLPGQFPNVGEATPALQLAWVLFVFVWRGCPTRWFAPVVIALVAMTSLHPVAGPLSFLAAILAAAFLSTEPPETRRRMAAWMRLFALAGLLKGLETAFLASPYEHANLRASAWLEEMKTGLCDTPFPALIPIFIERALSLGVLFQKCRRAVAWGLWAAAFAIGAAYTLDASRWASCLNYRKFGIVVLGPVLLMAALDAWRARKAAASQPSPVCPPRIPLVVPACLFALMLSCLALTWKSLCDSFLVRLAAHPQRVLHVEDLPQSLSSSALNHWSTTSLSLILQGWSPKKVFIWNAKLQCPPEGLRLCPDDRLPCEDGSFKLGWIKESVAPESVKK